MTLGTRMMSLFILAVVAVVIGLLISSRFYTQKIEQHLPPSGQFVAVQDHRLHVIQAGDTGPAVLLLHGASANAREYSWSLIPRLSSTHRLFSLDRPGHGYSDRPEAAHQLAVQAAQAAHALKALAPGERVSVVGHSFGGAVALRLALDYPELVSNLVLLAPVTHDWGGGGEAWYNRYAAHPWIGPVFNHLPHLIGPAQVNQSVHKVFSPQPAPEGYYDQSGVGLLFRPSAFRANAEDVNALRGELAAQQSRYSELTLPIVVYSGAGDTVLSPQLHVGKLKHQVPHLQLVKLAEGGHMPHHAYGAEIAETLRQLSVD